MLDANPPAAAAHHLNRILRIYQMITKHPQNGSAKGISSAGKTYEDAVRAAVEEQYLPTVPVTVHRMEFFYNSAAEPDCPDKELLKLPI